MEASLTASGHGSVTEDSFPLRKSDQAFGTAFDRTPIELRIMPGSGNKDI